MSRGKGLGGNLEQECQQLELPGPNHVANLRHLPDQLPGIVLEATRKLQDPLLEGLLQHYAEFIAFAHGGEGDAPAPSPSELLPLISEVRFAIMVRIS